jgi:hypothetical protein
METKLLSKIQKEARGKNAELNSPQLFATTLTVYKSPNYKAA